MLNSADFAELQRRAAGLATKNHHRYLSEALSCLRQRQDPVAALELLSKLRDSTRDNEREALDAVCTWLNTYLSDPIPISVADLELRLVWTRRIARIAEGRARDQGNPEYHAPANDPSTTSRPHFQVLRQRYPKPPPPPPPPLPPLFRAMGASPIPAKEAASDESDRRRQIDSLLKSLRIENALTRIPEILKLAQDTDRYEVAKECAAKFDRKKLIQAQREDRPWVRALSEILSKVPDGTHT